MDRKSIVGKKHLASSRKLGLAISLAIHAFIGFGIVAINTKPIEQTDFESLEEQSIEINTLSILILQIKNIKSTISISDIKHSLIFFLVSKIDFLLNSRVAKNQN